MNNRQIKDMLYEQVARIAKASASPKRLELIELLCQAPMNVEALAREAQISVKLASAHLKDLKGARLVEAERHGKYVQYRLADPDVAQFWVAIRMLAETRLTELRDVMERFAGTGEEWNPADRTELLLRAKSGEVIVLDVRPQDEFHAAHLPYARSLPLDELETRLSELPKDKRIVAYCRGPFCLMAKDAVELLRARGFDAVKLSDGVAEWAIAA
jgi:rhodanese-related sulfurtransferase/DNA-binding transcriptional ArsR family regulator